MARHLIIGAGPIGRATTTALQKRGHTVTIATRSGTRYGSAESVTLDATDTPALTRAATGCDSIIVCTNPPYHQWAQEWPPIIDSVVRAAVTHCAHGKPLPLRATHRSHDQRHTRKPHRDKRSGQNRTMENPHPGRRATRHPRVRATGKRLLWRRRRACHTPRRPLHHTCP